MGAKRLVKLRELMEQQGLEFWLVPHGDEYKNEFPPAYAKRLGWLTGFTGSAGFCIVGATQAIVFVDGRYTTQIANQIDADHFTPDDLINNPPHKWLAEWLESWHKNNQKIDDDRPIRIGFDPWLISLAEKARFEEAVKPSGATLISSKNLIDEIWHDQPHLPLEPVKIHEEEFAGKLAIQKIEAIKEEVESKSCHLCLISDPASIAWLFNIRGADTSHTPLALGHAIIRNEGYPLLFMDKRKMPRQVEAYLTQLADIHPPSNIDEELAKLVEDIGENAQVLTDFGNTSCAFGEIITANNGNLVKGADPIALARAIKNPTEIKGSRKAHLHDGVGVTKFLCWLDQQVPGSVDEISAAKKLESLRATSAQIFDSELMDISFDTISGAGANGAIIHYRVNDDTNAILENNSLYLVDSGGQYVDGTTDITRTIAIGKPPAQAIMDFTLVLKGHIAIALASFPIGTRGIDIDAFARAPLWRHGRDFAHGTGHGVGSYLCVHEGPQSISRRGLIPLEPGMIISNEPGFYREGQYGIRIENLVLVKEPRKVEGGNIQIMGFETLSLAPIDLRLIDVELLNANELHWLNAYHGWVKRQLSAYLDEDENKWLEQATRPIAHELPAASA